MKPKTKVVKPPPPAINENLKNAGLIIAYAQESVASLNSAFDSARKKRGAQGGFTTNNEQDLLRAILVFSAAALDSLLKQVIRDCLRDLCNVDKNVQAGFEEFVERRLRAKDGIGIDRKILAATLSSRDPKDFLIEEYVTDLTGSSLQSYGQLEKVIHALGLDRSHLTTKKASLEWAFAARNQIIHEFDIRIQGQQFRKNRIQRTMPQVFGARDAIFRLAEAIIIELDKKLPKRMSKDWFDKVYQRWSNTRLFSSKKITA